MAMSEPNPTPRDLPPADSCPTDWSAIRRLVQPEDVPAWNEFYARYGPLIRGFALKTGLAPDEADDVVQDTVVSMVKQFPRFRFDPAAGSFKSWLLQLAHWRILNQRKKRLRFDRADLGPGAGSLLESATTPTEERVPDPAGDALRAIWDAEWEQAVIGLALARLRRQEPLRHYQVFYLNVIKGQSPSEVARALGTSIPQVYLVKHRLLPRFRRIVEDLGEKPL
jgi:RNA polymerase sigma factor (sigma-70 family)